MKRALALSTSWAALLVASLSLGCSSLAVTRPLPWHKMPLDASTGFYQSATMVYRLDAGRMQQPLDAARVEGQKLWYEQVASSPMPDESTGTLTISYPHPAGRQGLAQVKFELDSHAKKKSSAWNLNPFASQSATAAPGKVTTSQPELHETWVLDIPSAESDGYFKVLGAQSFYDTQRPQSNAAHLVVTINGKRLEKTWDPIPQLNLLIQRVRGQGQLVAYSRPDVLAGRQAPAISSVQHYNQVMAQTTGQHPAAVANLAANPFSMGPPLPGQFPQGPATVVAQNPAAPFPASAAR